MIVRDRGLLYYRLLKADVKEAKNIVCGSQKLLSEYTSPPKAVRIFPSTFTFTWIITVLFEINVVLVNYNYM